jgi:glycosyltransferase involved in cell wall biosynthesis
VQDSCKVLARRGHRVELFTTNQDGSGVLPVPVDRPIEQDGYVTTYFESRGPAVYPIARGLHRALDQRISEFDVIEIHGLYLFHSFAAASVSRRRQVPYVVQPHGTLNRYQRGQHRWRKAIYTLLVERRNLDRAAAIHYTTDQERQEAEETGIRAPGIVVPLGVDTGRYGTPVDRDELPRAIPRDVPLITFVGRVARKKGLEIAIDAISRVALAGLEAHLVIAGPDSDGLQDRLESEVTRLGVSRNVTFTGMLTGVNKVALLQQSHAFVLPSRDENFGIAVVEALAAGVPVIISRGVAIHREVETAGAGIVVDTTGQAVAHGLLRLLSDERRRRDMAESAKDLAGRRFSLDVMGQGLEAMYRLVTDRE